MTQDRSEDNDPPPEVPPENPYRWGFGGDPRWSAEEKYEWEQLHKQIAHIGGRSLQTQELRDRQRTEGDEMSPQRRAFIIGIARAALDLLDQYELRDDHRDDGPNRH